MPIEIAIIPATSSLRVRKSKWPPGFAAAPKVVITERSRKAGTTPAAEETRISSATMPSLRQ